MTLSRIIAAILVIGGAIKVLPYALDWIGRLFDLAQLRDAAERMPAPLPLPYEWLLLLLGPVGIAYLIWDVLGRPYGPRLLKLVWGPEPSLEFVWPSDRGQNLYIGREATELYLIVRNPPLSGITLENVKVVREWWTRKTYREMGADLQRDELALPLQFGEGTAAMIEPGGEQCFRLCVLKQADDEGSSSLVVPSRVNAGGFDAGTGEFQFQVRARADNAEPVWDLYEVGVDKSGFTFNRKSEAVIRS